MAHESTIACVARDFPEWHKGRGRYAVWVLELDDPGLLDVLGRARDRFSDVLLTPYNRQPHVTVSIGGFIVPRASLDDDYSDVARAQDINALESARLPPFMLTLGPLDTFSTALHFHIQDSSGTIATIRKLLNRGWDEGRTEPYVAHVTVGLYSVAVPMNEIQRRLAAFPSHSPTSCTIHSLSLMTYEASVTGGPLTLVTRVVTG